LGEEPEDYVKVRRLEKYGKKRWRRYVADVAHRMIAAVEPDEGVLGRGNVKRLSAPSRNYDDVFIRSW